MSGVLQQWVGHLTQMFQGRGARELVASIPLDPSHVFWPSLKEAVTAVPSSELTVGRFSSNLNPIREDAREVFGSMAVSVLKHIKGNEHPEATAEEIAVGDFQRLNQAYVDANRLYGMISPEEGHYYPFMNNIILQFARTLLQLCEKASGQYRNSEMKEAHRHEYTQAASLSTQQPRSSTSTRSIRDTTRQTIEKSFQISSAPLTEADWFDVQNRTCAVGDNIWPLANILWRIYAQRRLHSQAAELLRSLENLKPHENKRLTARAEFVIPADLCQTYYWRGRILLVLLSYRPACDYLEKAFATCPETAWKQRRSILIRLIPIKLLLGYLPNIQLLQTYDLLQFIPLMQAFRTGNIPAWRRELDTNREWYRKRSIWLLLHERGEILVWRNLFRNALRTHYSLNQAQFADYTKVKSCPTRVFVSATAAAFDGSGELEDGTITLVDIINVLCSLIDQGFVLGFISYSQQLLAMKVSQDGMGAFPPINQVRPRHVEANG